MKVSRLVPRAHLDATLVVSMTCLAGATGGCQRRAPEPDSSTTRPGRDLFSLYGRALLVPSRLEQHLDDQQMRNRVLETHLLTLDQVDDASVRVDAPRSRLFPSMIEASKPSGTWSASVTARIQPTADRETVRDAIINIASSSVAGLIPQRVHVQISSSPEPPVVHEDTTRLVALGPVQVTRASKSTLQLAGALLLGLIAALAAWILVVLRANAALRARLARLQHRGSSPATATRTPGT